MSMSLAAPMNIMQHKTQFHNKMDIKMENCDSPPMNDENAPPAAAQTPEFRENCAANCDAVGEIVQGGRFESFAQFERAFDTWKAANFHPFRVASSETLKMPDGSANDQFKYRYIVYHCAHYGMPRMRGAGKRPNQNYLPCGCRAMLRLNFGWAENALRITTLHDVHTGHDVSADNFYRFATKTRKSSPSGPSIKQRRTCSRAQSQSTNSPGGSPVTGHPKQHPLGQSQAPQSMVGLHSSVNLSPASSKFAPLSTSTPKNGNGAVQAMGILRQAKQQRPLDQMRDMLHSHQSQNQNAHLSKVSSSGANHFNLLAAFAHHQQNGRMAGKLPGVGALVNGNAGGLMPSSNTVSHSLLSLIAAANANSNAGPQHQPKATSSGANREPGAFSVHSLALSDVKPNVATHQRLAINTTTANTLSNRPTNSVSGVPDSELPVDLRTKSPPISRRQCDSSTTTPPMKVGSVPMEGVGSFLGQSSGEVGAVLKGLVEHLEGCSTEIERQMKLGQLRGLLELWMGKWKGGSE